MLKRTKRISCRYFCFWSFVLLITATLVMTAGITFAQAKKAVEQKAPAAAGLVDINSASQKELEEIKGVGPVTAKKIIDGRPYKSVDELSKAGLNAKTIESVKPFVTVGKAAAAKSPAAPAATAAKEAAKPVKEVKPVATAAAKDATKSAKEATKSASAVAQGGKVNINNASKAALEALPEIGPVKAQAIIDGRPYKTIEDVMKVSGIKEKTFEKIKDLITVR
jgi:competence ComEA-like helix-hairpin-helix protein